MLDNIVLQGLYDGGCCCETLVARFVYWTTKKTWQLSIGGPFVFGEPWTIVAWCMRRALENNSAFSVLRLQRSSEIECVYEVLDFHGQV